MTPEAYEAWYDTPRGRWIGALEYALLDALLRPGKGGALLDVGCGTGHFTRRFAGALRGTVVGIDPDAAALAFAAAHCAHSERYVAGHAEALPFSDASFDCAIAVTSLCFVRRQADALAEILRVTRQRFALGLLNRHSLLYLQKGRHGGTGAYRGAHWHTAAEIRATLVSLGVTRVTIRSAILLPQGSALARRIEPCWPHRAPLGGFLAVIGEVPGTERGSAAGQPAIAAAGPRRPVDPIRRDMSPGLPALHAGGYRVGR
jgi:SAM-dependent methyltransferase